MNSIIEHARGMLQRLDRRLQLLGVQNLQGSCSLEIFFLFSSFSLTKNINMSPRASLADNEVKLLQMKHKPPSLRQLVKKMILSKWKAVHSLSIESNLFGGGRFFGRLSRVCFFRPLPVCLKAIFFDWQIGHSCSRRSVAFNVEWRESVNGGKLLMLSSPWRASEMQRRGDEIRIYPLRE